MSAPPGAYVPISSTPVRCPGVCIQWPPELGAFNEIFPFHRVGPHGDLPFNIEIRERGSKVVAWSKDCEKYTPHSSSCQACHSILWRLDDLRDLAYEAKAHTNYKYLNHRQLHELLDQRNEDLNKLKLNVCIPVLLFNWISSWSI